MAERTDKLNIKVEVTGKKQVDDFKQGMKEWRDALRLLELQFKQGKIAGGEFQKQSAVLTQALKTFEDGSGRTASAQNALWHANNRVTLGFKSLATEVSGIHNKMRPAGEQLREFYREQRVGDRTMREGVQTLQMFAPLLGEGVGGAAAKAAGMFQQTEFAVNGLGIAAQSAGGKIGTMGAALLGIAAPLTAVLAIGGLLWMRLNSIKEGTEAATKALFDLNLELGRVTPEQAVAALDRQIALQKERVKLLKEENASSVGRASVRVLFGASTKEIREAEVAVATLEVQRKRVFETTKEAQAIKEMNKYLEERNALFEEGMELDTTGVSRRGNRQGGRTRQTSFSIQGLGGVTDRSGGRTRQKYFGNQGLLKKAEEELTAYESAFVNSMSRMGESISRGIGQGFTNAFQIGHTLLGQFLNDFISGLARIGVAELFGMIPVVGNVLKVALGGGVGGGSGGGSGGGFGAGIAGGVAMPRSGGGQPIQVIVNGDFGYDKLSFAVESGDRIRMARAL